jgi:hypothetical protein
MDDKADYEKKKHREENQQGRLCQGNARKSREINKGMSKIVRDVQVGGTSADKGDSERLQKDEAEAQYAVQGANPPFLQQGEYRKIYWEQKGDGIEDKIVCANRIYRSVDEQEQGSVCKRQDKKGKDQPTFVEAPGKQHARAKNSIRIDKHERGKRLRHYLRMNTGHCSEKKKAPGHKK